MGKINEPGEIDKEINFDEVEKSLLYFATSIFGKNTEEEILWDLAKNCISQLGFVDCVVYLVDDNNEKLIQIAAYGPKNPKDFHLYQPIEIAVGKGITGYVAKTGNAVIVGDTTQDDRYIVDDHSRFSEIAVPIIYQDKVLGVIDSEHHEKHFFTQQHLRILTSVASLCANKIVRARVEDEMKQNQKKLLELERQLVDLKLMAIRSQMNPHFIFNSLNAIQHFITINDKKSALGYLSNFSKFIRIILKNSGADWVLLTEEHKMLYHYLELQMLRYDRKFTYAIDVDIAVDIENRKVPPSIIQPFVENSVTYGLLPSDELGHISISFSINNQNLICKINDNGIKRKTPWNSLNGNNDDKDVAFEYDSLYQRINLLNDSLDTKVKVSVEEHYAKDVAKTGTSIIIEFN